MPHSFHTMPRCEAETGEDEQVCLFCLQSEGSLVHAGCACRKQLGTGHVECRIKAAKALVLQKSSSRWWYTCQTCEQRFCGTTAEKLGEAWCTEVFSRDEGDCEKLDAALNMATLLSMKGEHHEAVAIERQVLEVQTRVLGALHLDTLSTTSKAAMSLCFLGEYERAEQMLRGVFATQRDKLGADSMATLTTASYLADCLSNQSKLQEAVEMQSWVLAAQKQALGVEHEHTMISMNNLASMYSDQGKDKEAEALLREVLAVQRRVFGVEHVNTLASAHNLVVGLLEQGEKGEVEEMARELVAAKERVFGRDHEETRLTVSMIAHFASEQDKHAAADKAERPG